MAPLSPPIGITPSMLITRLFALVTLVSTVTSGVSAATVTWTQAGSSGNGTWSDIPEKFTDNMNWMIGANWSGGTVPDASSQIVFGNVTSRLNDAGSGLNINGRAVGLMDADFFGDATSSLTLEQTSTAFRNVVAIRHSFNVSSPTTLTFQIGQVDISANSELRYQGYATANTDTIRSATFGYGGNTVTNNGTFLVSYVGTNSNRSIIGGLSIAVGSTFTNNGSFTLNASAPNNQVQGGTRVNAVIGNTINSGTMTISRSGDSTGAPNISFDAAQGGIEFASLQNVGTSSNFNMTVNNATTLALGGTPPVTNRVANLVISGTLRNEGVFSLSRTPLNSTLDTGSRTFTAQAGVFKNEATGSFEINHVNSATPITTTSSLVEFTVSGQATNEGRLFLSGQGKTLVAGNLVTRLVTQSGFTNKQGGIITVAGQAVLQNTGNLANLNTAASRIIQGATQTWDTRGLQINTTGMAGGSQLEWATGVVINTSTLSASTFSAANFTLSGLQINGLYTLSGSGDLLIADSFLLSGTLNLGDWTSITTSGGKGQTLLFGNASLSQMVSDLITGGQITAQLADGYHLSVIPNGSNDAFYIGVVAIPEPATSTLATLLVTGGLLSVARRRLSARSFSISSSPVTHDTLPPHIASSAQSAGLHTR